MLHQVLTKIAPVIAVLIDAVMRYPASAKIAEIVTVFIDTIMLD